MGVLSNEELADRRERRFEAGKYRFIILFTDLLVNQCLAFDTFLLQPAPESRKSLLIDFHFLFCDDRRKVDSHATVDTDSLNSPDRNWCRSECRLYRSSSPS